MEDRYGFSSTVSAFLHGLPSSLFICCALEGRGAAGYPNPAHLVAERVNTRPSSRT